MRWRACVRFLCGGVCLLPPSLRVCQTITTTTAGVSNTTIVVVVVVVPPRRRRRREEKTHGAHIGKVNGFLIPREDSSRPIQNLILLFRKSHWMEPLKKRKTREKVRSGTKKSKMKRTWTQTLNILCFGFWSSLSLFVWESLSLHHLLALCPLSKKELSAREREKERKRKEGRLYDDDDVLRDDDDEDDDAKSRPARATRADAASSESAPPPEYIGDDDGGGACR